MLSPAASAKRPLLLISTLLLFSAFSMAGPGTQEDAAQASRRGTVASYKKAASHEKKGPLFRAGAAEGWNARVSADPRTAPPGPHQTNGSDSMNVLHDSTASITVHQSEDFEVTGTGEAAAWEHTEWVVLPERSTPGSGHATRLKTLYSDTGLYLLFHCEDETLTATMKEDFRDLWKEDVVEAFLWPEEDFPVYFEYELSPLNYELPILVPNNDGDYLGWRPWHYEGDRKTRHATSVQGGPKESGAAIDSWRAEIFIPFALLHPLGNVPPTPGTTWRANFYRVDHDEGQTSWQWQPTETSFHEIDAFGTLRFE